MTVFEDFAALERWVAWRNEPRGEPPKFAKVPYGRFGLAKANDASTWMTRQEALSRARAIVNGHGGGIGIELGFIGADLYLGGVDLDSSLINGAIAPWAAPILRVLESYAEISPSGCGLKSYFYVAARNVRPLLERIGVTDGGWGCKRGIPGYESGDHGPAIEVYLSHRFFAVTGNRWAYSPNEIRLLDDDVLQRLIELVPRSRTRSKQPGSNGGADNSRSGKAWRIGLNMRREGKSFDEFCEVVRTNLETAAWSREKGEISNKRELHKIWNKASNNADASSNDAISEDALALEFTAQHPELRYVAVWGSWMYWSGALWVRENTLKAYDLARAVARATPGAKRSAKTVSAIENLARSDRKHAKTHDDWDVDDWIFNEGLSHDD